MSSDQEHKTLEDIFKVTLKQIEYGIKDGTIQNPRTSILPYVLQLAEEIILPQADRTDDGQMFAIATSFWLTVRKFMTKQDFIGYLQSTKMQSAELLLDDLLSRPEVTREDVDAGWEKYNTKAIPGVG